MTFLLKKDDPYLFALLLGIAVDPMPYTIADNKYDAAMVDVVIREDVPIRRIYDLGGRTQYFLGIWRGLIRDHKPTGKHFDRSKVLARFLATDQGYREE